MRSFAPITYGETSDVRIIAVSITAPTSGETWPYPIPSVRITSENSLIWARFRAVTVPA